MLCILFKRHPTCKTAAAFHPFKQPFTRVSSEVNIFDRFLFSGLIKRRGFNGSDSLLRWLLRSLDRDLPPDAVVNLFARSGDRVARENHDQTAMPYSVADISAAVKRSGWQRDGPAHHGTLE